MHQYCGKKLLTFLDNYIILVFKDGGETFRDKLILLNNICDSGCNQLCLLILKRREVKMISHLHAIKHYNRVRMNLGSSQLTALRVDREL